jgi:hypothetical protein
MKSLREEIQNKLYPYCPPENDKWHINTTQEILTIIEKKIEGLKIASPWDEDMKACAEIMKDLLKE